MKILKYLLSLILLALVMMLFGVMFASNIVTYMTKSKDSEFGDVKCTVINSEMTFENFVING